MPNLNEIIEIAGALETKAVLVAEDRCVVVRNRNAKCRRCSDACPVDAISIEANTVLYDSRACVSCGACTVVCPTEALIPLRPPDIDLAGNIAAACIEAQGVAVFACARASARREADTERYAEVPCLARMEESVLIALAASGVTDIVLVDGTCSTCKFRACNQGIDAMVASANTIFAVQGSAVRIVRTSTFPESAKNSDTAGQFGVSRRGFFTQAKDVAKDAAEKTVVTALKKELASQAPSLRDRLKMSDTGSLPQFHAVRRTSILDAMDRLGTSVEPEFETRLWGSVEIDTDLCTSCGMCTVFCPTGALRKSEVKPDDEQGSFLEFSVADCVACKVCSDICLKKCITVSSTVSTSELFDFEPRMIYLPAPPTKPGLLSGIKR